MIDWEGPGDMPPAKAPRSQAVRPTAVASWPAKDRAVRRRDQLGDPGGRRDARRPDSCAPLIGDPACHWKAAPCYAGSV